jgi:hypothetical protein
VYKGISYFHETGTENKMETTTNGCAMVIGTYMQFKGTLTPMKKFG